MTSTSQFTHWFRVAWGCLLTCGLTYYLIRAWRRKAVTMVGSYGTRTVSRESFPVWYWGWMSFYFVVDVFFCYLVYASIHKLLDHPA